MDDEEHDVWVEERSVWVDLERSITLPQGYYTPSQVEGFYAVEFDKDSLHFNFFGVPLDGDRTCAVSVRHENVRAITHLPSDDTDN